MVCDIFFRNIPLIYCFFSHRHKEAYTWTNPLCCVHNIILGKLWIEQYGTVEIVNHRYDNKHSAAHLDPVRKKKPFLTFHIRSSVQGISAF